ncbi:hypothetical protein DRJ23_01725 [Candidatus Acetothermia bacterium]|jgi:sugar phosphate isomerase/epimerase|nr:sugar phosphate isomerase/epimerase [Candidatus Bipolaricaulota bacterium]RLE40536.1 MAG: hypothetical protein DRJ23_01725 [Candidatus Acetothermia bacterium]
MKNKLGLNIHSGRIDGDLKLLKRDLAAIQEAGADVAEIPVHGVDAIVNGHLRQGRTKKVRDILRTFDLEYTVHAPDRLNLVDFEYPEIQRKVFAASIRFAAEIGAKILVYHQGRLKSNGQGVTEEEAREIEIDELTELGHLAAKEGVTICVENIHSGLVHLVKMIKAVDEDSVQICSDFAHSYINACTLGYDFLRPIQMAKPFIRHAHVNDNFGKGKPESAPPYIEAMPMGIGDLHLPVGWGTIPYKDVFKLMSGYSGIYILELQERFVEDGPVMLKEALKDLRELITQAQSEKEE